MGLHHRKLIPHFCTLFSNQTLSYCSTSSNNNHPSPTPPIFPHKHHHSLQVSTFLIITITFLVLVCFLIYASFFSRIRRSQLHQSEETRDIFFDVEYSPMRTSGLLKSLISENIAVCKYKKGEALVEGTECSVCLSEFEEDESLRILPKCNHAFHVSCIDTWLVSHSNWVVLPLWKIPRWRQWRIGNEGGSRGGGRRS